MDMLNDYYEESSWGQFSLDASYEYVNIDYDQDSCGDYTFLGYYGEQAGTEVDVMAMNAAGVAAEDYDFHVVVVPYCAAAGFGGLGYVGLPASAINFQHMVRGTRPRRAPRGLAGVGQRLRARARAQLRAEPRGLRERL